MHARLPPSLSHGVPRAASRPLSALPDAFVNRRSLAPASTVPGPRVLSSAGIARLHRYYDPIRHPKGPVPRLAAPPLASSAPPATPRGFPCCTRSLFRTCRRHYPGGTVGCSCRFSFPNRGGLPRIPGGSASALPFSRPARRSLLVTACALAESLRTLFHRKLQPLRCLRGRSDCYRLERHLPGGIRTHWDRAPLRGTLRNPG